MKAAVRTASNAECLKLAISSKAQTAIRHRKQVTSQAWLSISWRSYQRLKPSLPIERAGSTKLLQVGDDGGVIRRPFELTRALVDGTGGAAHGELRREQDVIDAQPPVALKRKQAVVPPGEHLLRLRKQAKG